MQLTSLARVASSDSRRSSVVAGLRGTSGEILGFDHRGGRLAAKPHLECRKAFGVMVYWCVDAAAFDYLGGGVSALDEPLQLRVQVGLRPRPEEVHAAFDLSDDLVRRPRFNAEQAEKRERCVVVLRAFLDILNPGVFLSSILEYGGAV